MSHYDNCQTICISFLLKKTIPHFMNDITVLSNVCVYSVGVSGPDSCDLVAINDSC
jgi:hypothetical protein